MEIRKITEKVSVSPQIALPVLAEVKKAGFRAIICNRPDGEGSDQPSFEEIRRAAEQLGIEAAYVPVQSGMVRDEDVEAFGAALKKVPRPVLCYCRTGTRSATLWSLHEAKKRPLPEILASTKAAGYDMTGVARRIANGGKTPTETGDAKFDVVIVGGGAAGIATASSLQRRKPDLSIAIIDPSDRTGRLKDIDIHFCNAGGVLFGVKDYVPALMEYVKKYEVKLEFFHNLVAVDGPAKTATFEVKEPGKEPRRVEMKFDMMHVCPPQTAPDFIRVSPLADAAGWVDVDPATLRHKTYENIWSLGDVMNAPNAKTAAAARKQAPTVAENIMADIEGRSPAAQYDGYGSCPLTVERGKIVLAKFSYGGVLKPSFPKWLIDGTKPSRLAWFLKDKMLPPIYWYAMLKGKEWLAHPEPIKVVDAQ